MRSTFKVTKIKPAALKIRMRTRRTETIPSFRETVLFCFVLFFRFLIFFIFDFLFVCFFFSYSLYDVAKVLLKTSGGSTELSPLEAALSLLLLSYVVRRDKMPLANERTRSAGFNFFLIFRHREIRFVFDSARIFLFLHFRSKSKANSRPTRGRSWT